MMRLADAALAVGGHCLGDATLRFSSVGTDSRSIASGQLFVALCGDRFDGHDFVAGALAAGAAAALVDARHAGSLQAQGLGPLLVVAETRQALGALAAGWRARFSLPLVGVTGSNGKTTVKEMCAAIFRAQAALDGFGDEVVLATEGNLNNDIGLPLMLLRLRAHHRHAVIEMGMNRPGEIAYLAGLSRPTVAVVNNAQRAHLEGLGQTDRVAHEKGAIYEGLGASGVAVVNVDDPLAGIWLAANRDRPLVRFGLCGPAEVSADCALEATGARLSLRTPQGEAQCALRVPGLHNVRNALAAAAATLSAGASLTAVVNGLGRFAGTPGRLQRRQAACGAVVLDDTYNANPDSVRAGIDVLAAAAGHKVLVLGDMGEIGPRSGPLHEEVGEHARRAGIDALFALGPMSAVAARNFGAGGQHFATIEDLVAALHQSLRSDSVVLVKGSRFMRMERVSNALAPTATADDGH